VKTLIWVDFGRIKHGEIDALSLGAPKDEEFIVKEWGCNP
jgi:hypothetical protein